MKGYNITFITGNQGKVKYLSDYFHIPVAHAKLDLREIQSLNLREIVEDKARQAFALFKKPVLVEDASLIFKDMNGLPGPMIKWFLEALGNKGLCRLVDSFSSREARAEVMFALCDKQGLNVFSGNIIKGSIAKKPRGRAGFGWDPIFIPKGHAKTWAEMSGEEKHQTSMRKIALNKMKRFLKNLT